MSKYETGGLGSRLEGAALPAAQVLADLSGQIKVVDESGKRVLAKPPEVRFYYEDKPYLLEPVTDCTSGEAVLKSLRKSLSDAADSRSEILAPRLIDSTPDAEEPTYVCVGGQRWVTIGTRRSSGEIISLGHDGIVQTAAALARSGFAAYELSRMGATPVESYSRETVIKDTEDHNFTDGPVTVPTLVTF